MKPSSVRWVRSARSASCHVCGGSGGSACGAGEVAGKEEAHARAALLTHGSGAQPCVHLAARDAPRTWTPRERSSVQTEVLPQPWHPSRHTTTRFGDGGFMLRGERRPLIAISNQRGEPWKQFSKSANRAIRAAGPRGGRQLYNVAVVRAVGEDAAARRRWECTHVRLYVVRWVCVGGGVGWAQRLRRRGVDPCNLHLRCGVRHCVCKTHFSRMRAIDIYTDITSLSNSRIPSRPFG